jgi:putative ABC transport system permease protein
MLKNYFTIAIRHLTRHKLFSIINIFCLAIGITFSMIIGMYILNQQSVNSQLKNVNNQYFIKSKWKEKDLGLDITTISPLAKTMKEEYPGLVANYYRYCPVTNVVSSGDKHFREDIAISDTTLISMYNFPLLYGNKEKAFTYNSSAVITETLAMKLFGSKNAIGKTISVQTTGAGIAQDYMVSAVLKDIPYNSVTGILHDNIAYSIYIPFTGNRYFSGGDPSIDWNQANVLSFVELKNGVMPQSLIQPAHQLIKKYTADFVSKYLDVEFAPVKDYYLKDNNGAVQKMVMILSLVAVFILLMVIINFVNINIGTSAYRLKEIGLRKVFGSARNQLIIQFIAEAWLLTFFAAAISIALYQLLLPVFSQALNTSLPSFLQFSSNEYIMLLSLIIFIGFMAGIYPAFILSASNLVNAVKGKLDGEKGGLALKRALLVVQFSLAIIVFICTLNVSRQISYLFKKDLGYNKEQLLVISAFPKQWDSAGIARMDNIKKGLLQLASVKSASVAFDLPDGAPAGRFVLYPPDGSMLKSLNVPVSNADEDYAKTFGIQMKAGSFFQDGNYGIVLNETAIKQLGMQPENAIGKNIKTAAGSITITGIMKDFNYSSMQDQIGPLAFVNIKSNPVYRFLIVKLNAPDVEKAMNDIKARWKSFSPNAPFDYTFMDEKFASLYNSELQLQQAADIATVLNLIIILLGIIGVVAFTLTKRNKEIAVRKILGADAKNIIFLFIKEYAWLILIANLIAWPIAYYVTNYWLQNFAYRIEQNMLSYLLVFVIIFIIAFGLILAQCFNAAVSNPVKSLRTE